MITFQYYNPVERDNIINEQTILGKHLLEDTTKIELDGYEPAIVDIDGKITTKSKPIYSNHHYLTFVDEPIPDDYGLSKTEKRFRKIENDIKALKNKSGLE